MLTPALDRQATHRISLFLILFGIFVLCAWLGAETLVASDRERILSAVEVSGGYVFSHETSEMWVDLPLLTLLEKSIGRSLFRRPLAVEFYDLTVRRDLLIQVSRIGSLREMSLHNAVAAAEDVSLITPLHHLEFLSLSGDQITDEALKELYRLPKLSYLILEGTRITDIGLVSVARIERLGTLILDGTTITDRGLMALSKMAKLQGLSLSRTRTSPAGRAALSRALPQLWIEPRDGKPGRQIDL